LHIKYIKYTTYFAYDALIDPRLPHTPIKALKKTKQIIDFNTFYTAGLGCLGSSLTLTFHKREPLNRIAPYTSAPATLGAKKELRPKSAVMVG